MELLVALAVSVLIGFLAFKAYSNSRRRKALLGKYGDPHMVDMIMRHMFWEGQSAEQLIDSVGSPADVDQKVLKSKVREVWKYNQTGRNRFGLRITLEDDVVVGWDKKS